MTLVSSSKILPMSFFIVVSFFLSSIKTEAQVSSSNTTLKFYYAAIAKVIKDRDSQIITLTDNIVLQSGNLIKFYLELDKEGYYYIFHEDSRGELVILFPKDIKKAIISRKTPIYIPEGNNWIELDSNIGRETFHIVVSAVDLTKLNELYKHHITLKEKDDLKKSGEMILHYIKSLKRQNFEQPAEKPIRIAGKLRGNSSDGLITQADFRNFVVEITTTGTYVKSVTIDHK